MSIVPVGVQTGCGTDPRKYRCCDLTALCVSYAQVQSVWRAINDRHLPERPRIAGQAGRFRPFRKNIPNL